MTTAEKLAEQAKNVRTGDVKALGDVAKEALTVLGVKDELVISLIAAENKLFSLFYKGEEQFKVFTRKIRTGLIKTRTTNKDADPIVTTQQDLKDGRPKVLETITGDIKLYQQFLSWDEIVLRNALQTAGGVEAFVGKTKRDLAVSRSLEWKHLFREMFDANVNSDLLPVWKDDTKVLKLLLNNHKRAIAYDGDIAVLPQYLKTYFKNLNAVESTSLNIGSTTDNGTLHLYDQASKTLVDSKINPWLNTFNPSTMVMVIPANLINLINAALKDVRQPGFIEDDFKGMFKEVITMYDTPIPTDKKYKIWIFDQGVFAINKKYEMAHSEFYPKVVQAGMYYNVSFQYSYDPAVNGFFIELDLNGAKTFKALDVVTSESTTKSTTKPTSKSTKKEKEEKPVEEKPVEENGEEQA